MHPFALLSTVRLRLRALFRAGAERREFSEEVAFHIAMETARHVAAGMSPADARRAALIAFGGTDRAHEDRRDATGVRLVDDVAADIRYAVRWLRRAPAFTASALGLPRVP